MIVYCNFCGIEHRDGDCLNQDRNHFKKAIETHGMLPEITFTGEEGELVE